MKTGNGMEYTYVVLEEDGLYYTGEYTGKIDDNQISFDRQLLCCDGIYPYAAINNDKKSLILYSHDGRTIVQ
jgi:hypothetical protein